MGGATVVWTGRAESRAFVAVGGLCIVGGAIGGIGLAAAGAGWLAGAVVGLSLFLAGLAMIPFSSLVATVTADGLHVRAGASPWPHVDVPLADIESVTVADIRPMRWGGWGYRGSLRLMRRAGWILRAGPGIDVRMTKGRRFAVTVDDAAAGVAALEELLTARSG